MDRADLSNVSNAIIQEMQELVVLASCGDARRLRSPSGS
jgi:hypothetical protein